MLRQEDGLEYFASLGNSFKKAFPIRFGPFITQLRVFHSETVRAIVSTTEPKARFLYRCLEPWIGDGLLVSRGHKWSRNRRLLTPAFHFDILKPYVNIFSMSANMMVEKWRRILVDKEQPLEMFEHVSLMTLDSLMKCIFGFQGNLQKEGNKHPYIQAVYEVGDLILKRFQVLPYQLDWLYHMSWSGYKFRRACRVIHTYSDSVIKEKKQQRSRGQATGNNYRDFMDMLLDAKDESGQGLSDSEMRDEVDTFMFEGHDTTASGISWTLYNLARHPEFQQKCRDEANEILGDRTDFTWEDIHKMSFIGLCVKESMRLHPPVPFIARQTTKPLQFPDGRTVPAGITVSIPVFSLHHNEDIWENHNEFDPYRFTPENSKGRSPHAYIPFSAGPRNCIGQNFALHEMKTAVGLVVKNFQLSEVKEQKVVKIMQLVLRSKGGLKVNVKPINI